MQVAEELLAQPPITAAEVESIDVGDSEAVAVMRYLGSPG